MNIILEALTVPGPKANLFPAGDSKEKGVKLDMLRYPLVLRCGGRIFPICNDIRRIDIFDGILDREETVHHTSHDETGMRHRERSH